jgi:hypothetical protein
MRIPSSFFVLPAVVLTLGLGVPVAHAQAPAPFLVGAAKAPVDPTLGTDDTPLAEKVCIGGYSLMCERFMKSVKDPMFARALAVTGDAGQGGTAIIITTTSVGLFAAYKPAEVGGHGATGIYDIRQRIAEAIPSINATDVVIQSDHSHAGPDVIGIWGGVPTSFMKLQADRVVAAAVAAYASRVPATISVASVPGTEKPTSSSYAEGPNAGHDDEFRLLVADAVGGERIATMVNYSPHATVLGSENKFGTSPDWPAWASQIAEQRYGGMGMGAIGAIGSMDWNKVDGNMAAKETEARARIAYFLDKTTPLLAKVSGSKVAVQSTFIREQLTQPILGANYAPAVLSIFGQADVRIDRAVTAPWLTGTVLGTYAGAIRIGDVFLATAPGEAFPRMNDILRAPGFIDAREHFFIGAANDFLGYMTDGLDSYQQSAQEGLFYLGGCPEEQLYEGFEQPYDGACPDHWSLMVSPTMGTHALCTIHEAAATVGFTIGEPRDGCAALTAGDGVAGPTERTAQPAPVVPEVPVVWLLPLLFAAGAAVAVRRSRNGS